MTSQVNLGLTLATKLETLRDMTQNNLIEPDSLKTVKQLGEGAFATGDNSTSSASCAKLERNAQHWHHLREPYLHTVDLCKYKPPTGGEALVAVKRLRPHILKDKQELANFVEETKLLRKLQHRCFPPSVQNVRTTHMH